MSLVSSYYQAAFHLVQYDDLHLAPGPECAPRPRAPSAPRARAGHLRPVPSTLRIARLDLPRLRAHLAVV